MLYIVVGGKVRQAIQCLSSIKRKKEKGLTTVDSLRKDFFDAKIHLATLLDLKRVWEHKVFPMKILLVMQQVIANYANYVRKMHVLH